MRRKLVVFDFDGVLVDSAEITRKSHELTCRTLGKVFRVKTVGGWRRWYDSRWERVYLREGFKRSEFPTAFKEFWKNADYAKAQVFPSIPRVLKELSKDYELAVVSTTWRKIIVKKLDDSGGLSRFFKVIIGSDDSSDKRGKLRAALKAAKRSVGESIMVGDTESDISAAKALGLKSIGVTYGWYSARRMRKLAPDIVVERPEDIPNAVERLFARA